MNQRTILVTGNLGYVGSVLVPFLKHNVRDSKIIGLDTGFFSSNLLSASPPERWCDLQLFGDLRNVDLDFLRDVDVVVHLAGISNDPIGNKFEAATRAINTDGTIRLINKAQKHEIKNFVFASSCSVYGFAGSHSRTEKDELNPLTAYAKSKIDIENYIESLGDCGILFTCLRFATAFGCSPRLRIDLAVNDFVTKAIWDNKIELNSDGKAFRPFIDVIDMCQAIHWAQQRKRDADAEHVSINVGSNENNFQIIDIARLVKELVPAADLIVDASNKADRRSYKVDFSLYEKLSSGFVCKTPIEESVSKLIAQSKYMADMRQNLDTWKFKRLDFLNSLIISDEIDMGLNWLTLSKEKQF